MLENLDSVPWHDLTHAYGSADDVPGLLRALAAARTSAEAQGPLQELFGSIWHQGSVYEATAHAVPFLFELVRDRNTPERRMLLLLLGLIAAGGPRHAAYGDPKDPSYCGTLSEEDRWVRRAHESVVEGFAVVLAIAEEDVPERIAAASVLAKLPEKADVVGPLLRRMTSEATDPSDRITLLLLLGELDDRNPDTVELLRQALAAADADEQFAAAASTAHLGVDPMPEAVRTVIHDAMMDGRYERFVELIAWDPYDAIEYLQFKTESHESQIQ